MKETLIIAGFGGQGVLSMGKILAYSGVMQDFEVTWMPSYGPEMRGGTANVTVILSDRKISSPIAHEFDTAIILNQQSMEKFEPMVRPGGILIYDTNGITRHPVREDIEVYAIDATAECARMGQAKLFNTMILGGYLKVRPVVEMENVMVGQEVAARTCLEDASRQRGGDPPRRRDHPQGTLTDPGSDGFPKKRAAGRKVAAFFYLAGKEPPVFPPLFLPFVLWYFLCSFFNLVFCFLFLVPSARPFCLSAVFFPSLAFHPRWLSLPPYSGSPPHRCDVLSGRRDRPGKPCPTQKRRLCIRFRISAQTRGFRIRTIPVKTVI